MGSFGIDNYGHTGPGATFGLERYMVVRDHRRPFGEARIRETWRLPRQTATARE